MFVIAGPCAIESKEVVMETARVTKEVCDRFELPFFFKSSFDKANRTSTSLRGVGIDVGLSILNQVKETYRLPIVTDVHESWQCEVVAQVADVIQIPAFLSRQTDLLLAALRTGKTVNVKKGQFMAPWDISGVIKKAKTVTEKPDLWFTERGSSFGYGRLVVDMSSLVIMRDFGFPIIYDATHSVQIPSNLSGITEGNNQFILPLIRAAVATGVDGVFIETHPSPKDAISDAKSQLPLSQFERAIKQIVAFNQTYTQQQNKENEYGAVAK